MSNISKLIRAVLSVILCGIITLSFILCGGFMTMAANQQTALYKEGEAELAKPWNRVPGEYDYAIGSCHFITAPDGGFFAFDHSPGILADGIRDHFGGDAVAFVKAYFALVRSTLGMDFDVVGHPDLVRKFNKKHPFFDESAGWYREEVEKTADAIAASGKIVELNTGAISRGWLDDAYPAPEFRAMLRERGVKFILSSDAHSADAIDCAFDRFAGEEFVTL